MLRANPAPAGETLRIVRAINDISANCFYFEVPISYDQLRQHGLLDIDKARFDLSVNQHEVGASPPARANNGNCYCTCAASDLLAGTNQLQVEFLMFGKTFDGEARELSATGPIFQFISTNICFINPRIGDANSNCLALYADLADSNATYEIGLFNLNGGSIRKLHGATTNGIIHESWNCSNDHGTNYLGHSVNAVFYVLLSNSLSQTINHVYALQSP
jgi:hypothetical protein